MKSNILVLFAIACLGLATNESAQAQIIPATVAGNQLEIGPLSSNQVYNSATLYSGAIGSYNYVTSYGSLAVGYGNNIGGDQSLCVGGSNVNFGGNNSILGGYNNIAADNGTYDYGVSHHCLVSGGYNQVTASVYATIFGVSNSITQAHYSFTAGVGLINNWSNCVLVGQYNAYQGGSGLLFVVGNGTDSTHRKNAIEVYADGTVTMSKAQGDISMGQFGN